MPPKKKKEPKNAYYFYMQDWRKWRAAEGQRFSLPEAAQFCNDDWKALPENERLKYKNMEAEAKKKDKSDLTNKYTSLGVTFEEIEREEKAKRDAIVEMENCIATTLANAASSRESLMNQVFHLAHANVYCYWGQEKVYIPCEVAISKFSIARGVISTYHVFPAPCTANGKIPLGYKFQVKQNSDAVHGIPDPSEFPQLEYDYRKISSDIHNFLRPDGGEEIPPLYTLDMDETNNNCHISAVRTFFDNVAGDSYNNFRVYSLTKLFFKLYEACQQVAMREFCDHERAFPVEGVAHQQLLKDVYNFSTGLACEFHEEGEYYHNCSLSFVKRWVFLICEFCCSALRIEMIPGRHCVATAKIEITWASESKKKAAESRCAPPPVVDDGDSDDDEDAGAWSVIPKAQRGPIKNSDKARTTADRIQQGIKNLQVDDRKELTLVKVPEAPRVFVMGQSPNVMSEIKGDDAPLPSVRLPTTRGRGEMLTRALNQQLQLAQQSSPGASFSSGDFPAIGEVRPGQAHQAPKPSGSGWGRGFMM